MHAHVDTTLQPPVGYFDRLASGCFGTSESDEILFYRFGPLSAPFVLPDAAAEKSLRAISASFYRRLVFGSAILSLVFPLLPLYWAAVFYLFASATSTILVGLPRSTKRLTVLGALRTRSMVYSTSTLAFATCVFAFLAIGCVYLLFSPSTPDIRFVGVLGFLTSTVLAIASSLMWHHRAAR